VCYSPVLRSFPTRRSSDLDALMAGQVFRTRRCTRLGEIVRSAYHRPLQIGGEAYRDHVFFDGLTQPNPGIEAAGHKVHRGVVEGDRKSTRLNSSHVKNSYA